MCATLGGKEKERGGVTQEMTKCALVINLSKFLKLKILGDCTPLQGNIPVPTTGVPKSLKGNTDTFRVTGNTHRHKKNN